MKSSWDITKQRSKYHFRTDTLDPLYDTVIPVGNLKPTWDQELAEVIEQAQPVTWRTRGRPGDPKQRTSEDYDREEYDLERAGMHKDYVLTNMEYDIAPVFQLIADAFGMEDTMARIHVQQPGQVWNLHLDKLEKWMPEDPSRVGRYFVQLTDWQPGHFWAYGNYCWTGWFAGSVTTFDWINVPHCTANAGHTPRVTLQVTGVKTRATEQYLELLSHAKS